MFQFYNLNVCNFKYMFEKRPPGVPIISISNTFVFYINKTIEIKGNLSRFRVKMGIKFIVFEMVYKNRETGNIFI